MKHIATAGLLSILLLTCNNLIADKPEIALKFNLQPGDRYLFSSVVNQHITQDMMGQQITTTQDISTDYIYDVQSVQSGISTINVTFNAIKMDTDIGGMQRLTYDSADPEAGTSELKVMSTLVGKSFLIYINDEGNVEEVEGLAEILGAVDGQQSEILKQSFSDSTMIQNMNQIINIYPTKAVAIGDTWTKTFSGPIAGLMRSTATSNFSLSKIEGDVAVLDIDGQMNLSKLTGAGGNPMLQHAEFNLGGTQEGTLEVDIKSGLPLQTKLKQDISGNIEIQGMQIPMTILSNITITGTKL